MFQRDRELKAALRREQGRLLAEQENLTIRDVTETRIVEKTLHWFFNQPPTLRDEILGDMKVVKEVPEEV
jgi:hypothetical protein